MLNRNIFGFYVKIKKSPKTNDSQKHKCMQQIGTKMPLVKYFHNHQTISYIFLRLYQFFLSHNA